VPGTNCALCSPIPDFDAGRAGDGAGAALGRAHAACAGRRRLDVAGDRSDGKDGLYFRFAFAKSFRYNDLKRGVPASATVQRLGGRKSVFREANAIARQFTRPIVISRKSIGGECTAAIGAYTLLNQEGYFLTAFHIVKQWQQTLDDLNTTRKIKADITTIQNDANLSGDEKRRRLKKQDKAHNGMIEDASLWLGVDGLVTEFFGGFEAIDLGIGKLQNFASATGTTFPILKDPKKDYEPGVSLCRLGYPFFSVTPIFDQVSGNFQLPSVPPFFSSEGIFCRTIEIVPHASQSPFPFPMQWIETSSPGLRGQSGGPIFDKNGTVWGIQSNTFCYPLGFEPEIRQGQKIHQFLSVGRGVHMSTVVSALYQQNVNFSLSAY
jgi:hypothetical protein